MDRTAQHARPRRAAGRRAGRDTRARTDAPDDRGDHLALLRRVIGCTERRRLDAGQARLAVEQELARGDDLLRLRSGPRRSRSGRRLAPGADLDRAVTPLPAARASTSVRVPVRITRLARHRAAPCRRRRPDGRVREHPGPQAPAGIGELDRARSASGCRPASSGRIAMHAAGERSRRGTRRVRRARVCPMRIWRPSPRAPPRSARRCRAR